MGFVKRITICFSILLIFGINNLYPKSIYILIDNSGSMKYYGDFTVDMFSCIKMILQDGRFNEACWAISGGNVDKLQRTKLIQNDSISILKFGSIQYDDFPYFSYPQNEKFDSSFSLDEFLKINLPILEEMTDLKTNKSLSKAVAAQNLDGKSKPWIVIMISDFLQDARMNKAQRDFVDTTNTCYLFNEEIALSWNTNDNVRMKIISVEKKPECEEEVDEPLSKIRISLLNPGHNKVFKSGESIRFQWNTDDSSIQKTYGFYINNKKDKNAVFAKSKIKMNSYSVTSDITKKWKPGEYYWNVKAKSDNKAIGESSSRTFVIKGQSLAALVYLLILAVLIGGTFTLIKKIREKRREED